MLRVIGVVINSSFLVEGVELEGLARDFGEVNYSDKPVRKFISRGVLIQNRFNNSEIDCRSGKIVRVNGFKFSGCNLYMVKDKDISKIEDNRIRLISRFVNNNETVGFEVGLMGTTKNFTTANTIALSELFKPDGFKVASRIEIGKRLDASGKLVNVELRKPYLVGASGNPLSNLPVKHINSNENSKGIRKDAKRTVQNADRSELELDSSKYGLYELIEMVKKYDGLVVTNKESTYIRHSNKEADKEKSLFVPLEMVEVATPNLSYSDKSVNANLKFRRLGFVYDNGTPIPTFLWREKSVFYNGKPNLGKFSIAISMDGAESLFREFGNSLSVEKSRSNQCLKSIESIFGKKDLVLLDVDASNLSVISANSLSSGKYMLSNKDILSNTLKCNKHKMTSKILKEIVAINTGKTEKEVFRAFKNYSADDLERIAKLGINIKDGSYNEPAKSFGDSGSDSSKISIEYGIVGMKSLPSVNKLINDGSKSSKLIEALGLEDELAKVSTELDSSAVAEAVNRINSVGMEINSIRQKLYLHKLSILEKNMFEFFDDSDNWKAEKARANQKAISYTCNEPGMERLCLTLDNINLK